MSTSETCPVAPTFWQSSCMATSLHALRLSVTTEQWLSQGMCSRRPASTACGQGARAAVLTGLGSTPVRLLKENSSSLRTGSPDHGGSVPTASIALTIEWPVGRSHIVQDSALSKPALCSAQRTATSCMAHRRSTAMPASHP